MSQMFPGFFGVPQAAIRSGKLKNLSGFAVKLYVALCHDCERYSTRELKRTTAQLQKLVGGAHNSHIKARKELKKAGLVDFEDGGAAGIIFRLCNPDTGAPWPHNPREKVSYQRKSNDQTASSPHSGPASPSSEELPGAQTSGDPPRVQEITTKGGDPAAQAQRWAKDEDAQPPQRTVETAEFDVAEGMPEWSRGAITYARGANSKSEQDATARREDSPPLNWDDTILSVLGIAPQEEPA